MRVKGDISPNVCSIEPFGGEVGKVEVRLRENIKPYEEKNEETGEVISGFEYDEYLFVLDDTENLSENIQNNFSDWLTTGRTLEIDPRATLYITAKTTAIDEYTEELIQGGIL
ncbi:hypothetical protein [Criibacterium bergeronii]|uniref:Uncharacterized protein n=1 Tax=Criibacterium bergeronii TaxID=1871336 RepID=A0A1C0ADY9_9FIRM|nr:hypothetical protein [Criibacterium bergeronii]RDY21450.1 hypothetical protein BBG48_004840 [Criibacterium bergeronii]